MTVKRTLLLALCLILFSSLAHAQRLTGTIRGTVTDDSGAPLPGVNVTLSSEALIGGPQLQTTNEQGTYRFPALPPGTYKIAYDLAGFQNVIHDPVRVSVGTTAEENATLSLAKVSESVTVSGEAPLVDPDKPGFSTNYTQEYLKETPIARFTFFDFVQMAPASSPMRFDNTAYAHSIMGSNTNENMYQMDGTDLTSSLTGAAWPWPNTDIIQEIEILDLGAPAEYGNFQGGVINVVTKSGGNQFHGDGNFYWQTQGLTADNAEIDGIPFHRDEYRDGTFQMGGPIMKDKIWVFGGVQARREHFSQPGTPPEFPVKENDNRYFFKGTWDINKNNKIVGSLHNDYYNIPETISITMPFETALVESGDNPTPNVTWTSTINANSVLEVRYAGFYGKDHGKPQNGQFVSGHYDLYTGYYSGGILSWYDGDIWKSQVSGKYSLYADNFLHGNHDFRFGVQYTRAGNNYIYAYTNGVKFYDYQNAPYNAYYQLPYHIGADIKSTGIYADDTWNFNNNLTLSLGVRFDHSAGSIPDFPQLNIDAQQTGTTIKGPGNVANWDVVSPRLGFTYHLPFKMATQIRGHYGRYYQAMLTPYLQRAGPARSQQTYAHFDPATGKYDDVFFSLDPASQVKIDPSLKDPYTDQFAVGFDRELSPNMALSMNYIYKRSRNFIGNDNIGGTYVQVPFLDPVTGQVIQVFDQTNDPVTDNLFLITNPSSYFENYKGFLISINRRMSNKWMMQGSLTISSAHGLTAGSGLGPADDQDSSFFQPQAARFGQDPNDLINASGLLNGDRTYILKIQGSYQLPWELQFSGSYSYLTGRPYAPQIEVTGLSQGSPRIFTSPRDGSLRVSNDSLLDLRIEKEFALHKSLAIALSMDIFNVFNSGAFTDVGSTLSTSDAFGVGSTFVPPRRVMFGAHVKF